MELESWRLKFQWVLVHEDEQIHREKEKNRRRKKEEEEEDLNKMGIKLGA